MPVRKRRSEVVTLAAPRPKAGRVAHASKPAKPDKVTKVHAAAPLSTESITSAAEARDVQGEAERVLAQVGAALRRVLDRLNLAAGAPRDLERVLGLHKTLCWRVLQVAYSTDLLAVAPHLPGDEGLEKFLRAASRRGVVAADLEQVRIAAARYREAIKSHAGDRASFEVMLQSLSSPQESSVELRAARRAGYRSASYAWGVQTAVRILSAIITPTAGSDGRADLATLRAHVGARRLRREGTIKLSRTIEHDTENPGERRAAALPIFPREVVGGVPLLAEFSTKPLPRLEAVSLPGRNVEYCFADQALGDRSAINVFTGEVRRDLAGARWSNADNKTNALQMTLRTPVALSILDLWAPPEFGLAHRALVVSAVGVDPLLQKPEAWELLPSSATVERIGRGLLAARIREVPEYQPALGACFDQLGWVPDDYELHRVRLEYPIVGSCLVLQTTLPPRP